MAERVRGSELHVHSSKRRQPHSWIRILVSGVSGVSGGSSRLLACVSLKSWPPRGPAAPVFKGQIANWGHLGAVI
jgi:hypothetical protein